jgi:hypothetical protein
MLQPVDWEYGVPVGVTDVVPLWSTNEDCYARWNRDGRVEFVLLHHDHPDWCPLAVSEQGLFAQLWFRWTDLHGDVEGERLAAVLGFEHVDEAIALWEKDFDEFEEWMRTLWP